MSEQQLPIYQYEAEIVAAVKNHRVIVVEGPPGCGKTTQLPRMLRRAGLVPRMMGVTQPRRIAATSVAARIAFEEKQTLGEEVGYAIRFDDRTSADTVIKVMTDGILLQETRGDERLSSYDIIMVDEAHERSLNIDLTLGLLLRAVRLRPDLRVVVSSATLNPGLFQQFFAQAVGQVPILSIPTRTHPVDIHYNPPSDNSFEELIEHTADIIFDLTRSAPPGHILCFLPGEGSINKVAALLSDAALTGCVVLPLFGRLPSKEQERVFEDFGDARKIVLSTNIAETSITIDGVVAVIDAGLAKVPWFDGRTGVTMLREEPICRASAAQRAGRAGRTRPGVVYRLYEERSMAERSEFGTEEILRIDLSEAVLRLIDLGVREVESFAFPTPPKQSRLRGAVSQLEALGAIDRERRLTSIGRRMVPFPLSPAIARMVVEAAEHFPEALDQVLLAGASLSVRSPFAYPKGFEQEARRAQRKLRHALGDTITFLNTYRQWQTAASPERFCKENFLEPDIMNFVERAHGQLRDIARAQGLNPTEGNVDHHDVIRCVARGFADKLLVREPGSYAFVTREGLFVQLHPSSALFNSDCQLAVATELMDSGRLYAFGVSMLTRAVVADIDPELARKLKQQDKQGRGRGRGRERGEAYGYQERSHDAADEARGPKPATSSARGGPRAPSAARLQAPLPRSHGRKPAQAGAGPKQGPKGRRGKKKSGGRTKKR